MSNLCSLIFQTMSQALLLVIKVWVKDHALLEQWLCKLGHDP